MEMKAQVKISGAKKFKGDLDGKGIDSGKLFVEVALKKSDNAFGVCTEMMKCTSSDLVESIKHLPFPFLAELTIDNVSGSKGMEQVVTGISPLKRAGTPAPAAA